MTATQRSGYGVVIRVDPPGNAPLTTRQPEGDLARDHLPTRVGAYAFELALEDRELNISTTRARLLASSMITSAALVAVSSAAIAQNTSTGTAPGGVTTGGVTQSQSTQNSASTVQELVVTGSRIPSPSLTSVSPLSVVDQKEIKFQGATNVETFLQNLPSVQPEFNQGVDNGASGTATVDLRNLGSKRTLVLVDGDRLMPGDPIVPSPDLNNIPAALVDRVEVVTGGASAVYGSDAVGGVVNFIMKKDFQGVRVDAQYGFADHNNGNGAYRQTVQDFNTTHASNPIPLATDKIDGMTYTATVVVGVEAPDGKGNVEGYLSYRNLQPITQDRRDAGACGISTVPSTSNVYDTHVCQGSSNSAYGNFIGLGAGGSRLSDNPDGSKTFVPIPANSRSTLAHSTTIKNMMNSTRRAFLLTMM